MRLSEKIKAIRTAEGLSQHELCEIIGLPRSTLAKYESGKFEPGGNALLKLTTHPQFKKYTLWLMTDEVAPEAGQVSPAVAHSGQDETDSSHLGRKIG